MVPVEPSRIPRTPRTSRLPVLVAILVLADYVPAPAMTILLVGYIALHLIEHSLTVPRSMVRLLQIPAVLAVLGLHGFLTHEHATAIKDLWRFAKYPLVISVGYSWARRPMPLGEALRPFVLAAGIACTVYIGARLAGQDQQHIAFGPLGQEYGRAPFSSFVGATILMLTPAYRVSISGVPPLARHLILILCFATLALSQSRTLIGSTALVVLLASLARVSWRVRAVSLGVLLAAGLGVARYLPALAEGADKDLFLGRTAASLEEVTREGFDSPRDVANFWRAYESIQAWRAYADGRPMEFLLGHGFGKTVDLGRNMPFLGDDRLIRSIPVLHNGYLYLLLKTGALGLVLYLAFFIRWLSPDRANPGTYDVTHFARLLRALMTIILLGTTFVTAGALSRHALFPVLVLLGTLSAFVDGAIAIAERSDSGPAPPSIPTVSHRPDA